MSQNHYDPARLQQRVEAIQAELASLQRDLSKPATRWFGAGYWSAFLDYWARCRKTVKLYCDDPPDGSKARLGDIVRVKGWSLGQSGIASLEIRIDDSAPIPLPHHPRPDLREAFPGMPGTDSAGFFYEWDTREYAPGPHMIAIRAQTADGHHAQLTRHVELSRLADFQIHCDEPLGTAEYGPHSGLRIRGWCAGRSPITLVEFNIDDGPIRELTYGRPRPELRQRFPEYPVNCGFEGTIPGLAPGEHRITIAARTRGDDSAVLKQNFFVRGMEDEVLVQCDCPAPHACQSVRDMVEFRGWALAWSGIQQVTIRVGNQAPMAASYGLPRMDVFGQNPQFPLAKRCGWRFFWDTKSVPEGRHEIQIVATSLSGGTATIDMAVVVDQGCDVDYNDWIAANEPTAKEKKAMVTQIATWEQRPRISIVVPVYKTPPKLLAACIDSVLAQIYPDWELCLTDDGSNDPRLTRLLEDYCKRDPRIRVTTLPRNLGISGATNAALALSRGDYVGFLDHDDELADFALWEVVKSINEDPLTDLFYSDEDKIAENGRRYDWFFKPEFSPELFFSCNYMCHFVVLRRTVLEQVKGLDERHRGGSQDYDFLLRITECTSRITRIPKVLYHWRAVQGSTAMASEEKPEAGQDGCRALSKYMQRNHPGATVEEVFACHYRVHYPIEGTPRIDIVMPTGGKMDLLRRAVDDVIEKTTYRNFEIVLVDNSKKSDVEQYARILQSNGSPVHYIDWRGKKFNYSEMNNEAVRQSTAPYILFLNDDMSIVTKEWLSAMLEHAQRPGVGAVGAQLWFPHDEIQHAGVTMSVFGNSGHAFKYLPVKPAGQSQYFDFPWLTRNCSAVTAACLLLSREKFWEVGGFDVKNLAVAFQDVDLCLKLLEKGYRNIYTPYAILYHYESATKIEVRPNPVEDHYMKNKWKRYIKDDPYYSPNLTRLREDYSIRLRH